MTERIHESHHKPRHAHHEEHHAQHPTHIKKERYTLEYFVIGFLIIILLFLIYYLYLTSFNLGLIKNAGTNVNLTQNTSISGIIGSDELHWEKMPVSFNFSNPEDCGSFQTYRIFKAFTEIEKTTNKKVNFIQNNNSADITIICNRQFLPSTEPGLIQSGEASVTTLENKIISAQIYFFNTAGDNYNGGCRNYPDVEIHEILHAFGFMHTDKAYNIMNAVGSYCPTKINQDIIDKLMEIYG